MEIIGEEDTDEEEEETFVLGQDSDSDFLEAHRTHMKKLDQLLNSHRELHMDYLSNRKKFTKEEYERFLRGLKKIQWQVTDSVEDLTKRMIFETKDN
jgi:hypothetical protein